MARAAIETINPLGFLVPEGHFVTQRIQEKHFFGSAVKSLVSIASTGQSWAQREHFVHSLVGFGTRPAPLFLYGRLPGMEGHPFSLEMILSAKDISSFLSSSSGLPAAYSWMMECSATLDMAATMEKPHSFAASSISIRVSS